MELNDLSTMVLSNPMVLKIIAEYLNIRTQLNLRQVDKKTHQILTPILRKKLTKRLLLSLHELDVDFDMTDLHQVPLMQIEQFNDFLRRRPLTDTICTKFHLNDYLPITCKGTKNLISLLADRIDSLKFNYSTNCKPVIQYPYIMKILNEVSRNLVILSFDEIPKCLLYSFPSRNSRLSFPKLTKLSFNTKNLDWNGRIKPTFGAIQDILQGSINLQVLAASSDILEVLGKVSHGFPKLITLIIKPGEFVTFDGLENLCLKLKNLEVCDLQSMLNQMETSNQVLSFLRFVESLSESLETLKLTDSIVNTETHVTVHSELWSHFPVLRNVKTAILGLGSMNGSSFPGLVFPSLQNAWITSSISSTNLQNNFQEFSTAKNIRLDPCHSIILKGLDTFISNLRFARLEELEINIDSPIHPLDMKALGGFLDSSKLKSLKLTFCNLSKENSDSWNSIHSFLIGLNVEELCNVSSSYTVQEFKILQLSCSEQSIQTIKGLNSFELCLNFMETNSNMDESLQTLVMLFLIRLNQFHRFAFTLVMNNLELLSFCKEALLEAYFERSRLKLKEDEPCSFCISYNHDVYLTDWTRISSRFEKF